MAKEDPRPLARAPAPSEGDESVESLLREAVAISEPSEAVLPGPMPGDVLVDRFLIERRAGSGGMGTIHRGTDLTTHQTVAIKVMASGGAGSAKRFAHEAALLAELSHAAVVRYVAHGTTAEGMLFLAMEWLEGEDLSERLLRAPLTVTESLSLIRRACEGVSVAHARGVVHRDIKPSNLFLAGRDPALTKVLDFGIARLRGGQRTDTASGTILGTVGYMSPEQAMGPRDVDARTDVFALGCVLFECLTGRPAFAGRNAVAVLAKVLREEPLRVSELRPELGTAFDALVAAMLAKNPDQRPNDVAAISRELDRLTPTTSASLNVSAPPAGLTSTEQRIVSVILAAPRVVDVTNELTVEDEDARMNRVRELTRRFDAEPVPMLGGGLLVVLSDRGAATDQARQAVACALLLRRLRPELVVAVATGRAETRERIPVGIAIDRAAALIGDASDGNEGVAIDDLTAGLLEPGFRVQKRRECLYVLEQRADQDSSRLLMGRPTPFIGREKELALLELTLRECIEESVARVVLVTGPPGQGKSRLRRELIARVGTLGARMLIARADPVGAGSAFLVARQLVRQAMRLREGDVADERARLRAHVARTCPSQDAGRIADFLGELVALPPPERPSPELRAARNDPQVMGSWLRRSFGEWLVAECAAGPLLLVLEDLHWGDLPSVTYLVDALDALATKPLMVLAIARPEINDVFPTLWVGVEKQELALGRLTPRAAERLVREAVGESLGAEDVAHIIERADGNAFYLEELIRHVAEGGGKSLPETVVALVQSRLERLEPEARLIVRAASVFGEVLWHGGIATLVRGKMDDAEVERELRSLVENEVLAVSHDSRFPREREYHFRHSLLREAAYAMLTEPDKAGGHRLAGAWLERAGEKDALTLADHFELGGEPTWAVPWLIQAAQAALDGGHLEAMVALADRGIACHPGDAERGIFGGMRAVAFVEGGDPLVAIAIGSEALKLLPVGSPQWLLCAGNVFVTATYAGDRSTAGEVLQALLSVLSQPTGSGPEGFAILTVCGGLISVGELELSRTVLKRAEAELKGNQEDDPVFVVGLLLARSYLCLMIGDLARALSGLLDARALADRVDLSTHRASARCLLIGAFMTGGSFGRAEAMAAELSSVYERPRREAKNREELRGVRASTSPVAPSPRSTPSGLGSRRYYSARSALFLAGVRLEMHRPREAISRLAPYVDEPDRQLAFGARAVIAHALLAIGDLDGAAREANAVVDEGAGFPSNLPMALGALALIALRRGQPADALALADRGIAASTRGCWLRDRSILRLTHAEALHALGRVDDARMAIHEARQLVLNVAATLEPALRDTYLTNISANARTLELASQWID